MKNFKYTGTQPYHATLRVVKDGKPALVDVKISAGDIISLDEKNEAIAALVRSKLLIDTTDAVTVKIAEPVITVIKKEVVAEKVQVVDDKKQTSAPVDNKNSSSDKTQS